MLENYNKQTKRRN